MLLQAITTGTHVATRSTAALLVAVVAVLVGTSHASLLRSGSFYPDEFLLRHQTPPGERIAFTIGLPSRNFDMVQEELARRALTREWLSPADVRAMTSTDADVRAHVVSHLRRANVTCVDTHSGLRCVATAASCNALFATTLMEYEHVDANGTTISKLHRVPTDGAFALPAVPGLLFAAGLTDFPTRRRRGGSIRAVGAEPIPATSPALRGESANRGGRRLSGDYYVVPETLWRLYGTATGSSASTTAPVEFGPFQAMAAVDISAFSSEMGIAPWTIAYQYGPFASGVAGLESSLDEEYLAGMGIGNTQYWWSMDSHTWMYEFTQSVLAASTTAMVYSISWGAAEMENCNGAACDASSLSYINACEQNLAAIALLGITIVASSGDGGAIGLLPSGTWATSCSSSSTLSPMYPASSAYVLSVGATQLLSPSQLSSASSLFCGTYACAAGSGSEVTCSYGTGARITSGGGFSNYITQPSWQSSRVSTYLTSGTLLPSVPYKQSGRAYPDVSAVGHNLIVTVNGTLKIADGTSASAPIWAAIIGLANAARLAQGLSTLGFVTPTLYSIATSTPSAFYDVTVGDNTCGESMCGCPGYGATTGWDATSGLGTPRLSTLIPALVAFGRSPSTSVSATVARSPTISSSTTASNTLTSSLTLTGAESASQTVSVTSASTASPSCSATATAATIVTSAASLSWSSSQTFEASVTSNASPSWSPAQSAVASVTTTTSSSLTLTPAVASVSATPSPSWSLTVTTDASGTIAASSFSSAQTLSASGTPPSLPSWTMSITAGATGTSSSSTSSSLAQSTKTIETTTAGSVTASASGFSTGTLSASVAMSQTPSDTSSTSASSSATYTHTATPNASASPTLTQLMSPNLAPTTFTAATPTLEITQLVTITNTMPPSNSISVSTSCTLLASPTMTPMLMLPPSQSATVNRTSTPLPFYSGSGTASATATRVFFNAAAADGSLTVITTPVAVGIALGVATALILLCAMIVVALRGRRTPRASLTIAVPTALSRMDIHPEPVQTMAPIGIARPSNRTITRRTLAATKSRRLASRRSMPATTVMSSTTDSAAMWENPMPAATKLSGGSHTITMV